MGKNKSLLYILAGLGIFVGVMAWLFLGESKPTEMPERKQANAVVKDSVLKEEHDGKLIWEMHIDEMEYDKAEDKNFLRGVKGKLVREDGSVINITSERGEVTMAKKDVILQGKVVAIVSTGGQLNAEEVSWLKAGKTVNAKGKVKITKDDMVATADKASTDTDLTQIKLEGNAEAQKGVE